MVRSKKLLAAGWHHGSVGAILPVIKRAKFSFATRVYAYDSRDYLGSQAFLSRHFAPDKVVKGATVVACKRILDNEKPDIILTGTSIPTPKSPEVFEQNIIAAAKEFRIRVVSVLDFWANYIQRFSRMESGKVINPFEFVPNAIAVMDEYAKKEMIKLGFDPGILHVTGNPEFYETHVSSQRINSKMRDKCLASLELDPNRFTVLLLTEEHEKYYGMSYGYNEYSYLRGAFETLEKISKQRKMKINIVVSCHPGVSEEHRTKVKEMVEEFNRKSNLRIEISPQSANDLLGSVDNVISTYSTVLIKARLFGIPGISFQPGLMKPDLLVTNEFGITTLCTSGFLLGETIQKVIEKELEQKPMPVVKNSVENILHLL